MTRMNGPVVWLVAVFAGCGVVPQLDPTRDAGCIPRSCPVGGGGACVSECGGGGGGGGGGSLVVGGGDGGGVSTCAGGLDNRPVTEPTAAPPAVSGGSMLVLRDGSFVIGDVDRQAVWLVSADFQTVRRVALAVGEEPGRIVEGPTGRVFVTLRRSSELAELDIAAGLLARRLSTCALPRGLAWREGDSRLVVACLDGALETLDPVSGARTPLPLRGALADVRDVVVDGARLLVTSFRAAQLQAVAADGSVTLVVPTPLPGFEPHVAWRAASRPGGGAVFVRQQHRSTPFTSTSCAAYGGFAKDTRSSGGGPGSLAAPVVQAEVVTVAPDSTTLSTALGSGFSPVVLPVDVAVSATGRVVVASAGTGSVVLLEPAMRREVPVVSGEGAFVTAVAFRGDSAFAFSRQPAALWEVRLDGSVQQVALLDGASVASTGHELFHRATPSGLACASCHPEAGEDGHVWPFFEGVRRTPTLRGGVASTKPFHWSGDLPTMASLMSAVMGNRMRGPSLSPERTTAVEDWLEAQPALPAPGVDVAAVARGQALFESERTACASCHTGAQGTDNRTVDVGTGEALQVPRLVELARRAPWFHDGRMPTLEVRFDPLVAGASHEQVADLTPADLLEYRSR